LRDGRRRDWRLFIYNVTNNKLGVETGILGDLWWQLHELAFAIFVGEHRVGHVLTLDPDHLRLVKVADGWVEGRMLARALAWLGINGYESLSELVDDVELGESGHAVSMGTTRINRRGQCGIFLVLYTYLIWP
jgi:hypothetical protein